MMASKLSDNCRFCKRNFKVQYGVFQQRKPSQISTENLVKPSQRKEFRGQILADVCKRVGITVTQGAELYSHRVCNPCGRKIRNLGALFDFFRNADTSVETPSENSKQAALDSRIPCRCRSDSLTLTPEGSSPCRKTARVNSPAKSSRKSLKFREQEKVRTPKSEETVDSFLNMDDLPNTEHGQQVKVLLVLIFDYALQRAYDENARVFLHQN